MNLYQYFTHQQLEHPITMLLVVIELSEPMIAHSVYHHCGEWIWLQLQLCDGRLGSVDVYWAAAPTFEVRMQFHGSVG